MKLFEQCWLALLELFNVLTLSSAPDTSLLQPGFHNADVQAPSQLPTTIFGYDGPIFDAPSSPAGIPFTCNYSAMTSHGGWKNCSRSDNRGCWLRSNNDWNKVYDIHTNYEEPSQVPVGTTRSYILDVDRKELTLDGITMKDGVVFNGSYPGPWIQACWGDTVVVTVRNKLEKYNGTTVHWHGIRQLNTMQMDGVNGVTQCPIAPGDEYTYSFQALQYGTTWYHSHYSLQYGDGLVGPLTIHGPSSSDYDLPIDPILMMDWNHRSAFADFSKNQFSGGGPPKMDSILLNGTGNFANMFGSRRFNMTIKPGKKYLLRLINTSVETTFVFGVDGHNLTVMSSDFVPIKPYTTRGVLVGIGQRYHVVLEAKKFPEGKKLENQNYWIRTVPAEGCASFDRGNTPDERQGILRYAEGNDVRIPRTARDFTDIRCRDEPFKDLVPILKWQVGNSSGPSTCMTASSFDVGMINPLSEEQREQYPNTSYLYGMFARWTIGSKPLWLDFGDPSVKHIKEKSYKWKDEAVVIPEGCDEKSWIFLLITGNTTASLADKADGWKKISAAHPIHLHGHDFALLQQSDTPYEGKVSLKTDNPPRRDVVLLPRDGFVVIAFKADNPGLWLLHCHIAFHASSGLALQILEREKDIETPLGWFDEIDRGCGEWNQWFKPENLWDKEDKYFQFFQDDSGI